MAELPRRLVAKKGRVLTLPEIGARLRRLGLKGAPNLDALEQILVTIALTVDDKDAGQVDYPRFFTGAGAQAAQAAQNASVALQARAKRTIVDAILVSTPVAAVIQVRSASVGQIAGFPVFLRNRGRDVANGQLARAQCVIAQQLAGAIPGDGLADVLVPSNTAYLIPLGHRMGPPTTSGALLSEECGVWCQTQNQDVRATFLGREWDDV